MTDDEKINLLTTAATHREMAPPTWTIADGHRCLADDCCTREERIAERERVRKRAASATAPIDVVVQTRSVAAPGCVESIRERPGRPLGNDDRGWVRVERVRWLADACEVALHNCERLIRASGVDLQRELPDPAIIEGELRRLGVSEHVGVAPVVRDMGTTLGGTVLVAWPKDATLREDVVTEVERRERESAEEAPVAVQLLRDLRRHLIYDAPRGTQHAEMIDRLTLALARAGALT